MKNQINILHKAGAGHSKVHQPGRRATAIKYICAAAVALLICASHVHAEEFSPDDFTDARPAPEEAGPIYSSDDRWVGPAVIVMMGLFLAAAVVGPIVRAEMPGTVPAAMSHQEDPAVDRH